MFLLADSLQQWHWGCTHILPSCLVPWAWLTMFQAQPGLRMVTSCTDVITLREHDWTSLELRLILKFFVQIQLYHIARCINNARRWLIFRTQTMSEAFSCIVMSTLCTCDHAHAWATILCRITPFPSVPGPRTCTVPEHVESTLVGPVAKYVSKGRKKMK